MEIGVEFLVYDREGRVATLTIPLIGRFSNCNNRQWPRQGKGRSHFIRGKVREWSGAEEQIYAVWVIFS